MKANEVESEALKAGVPPHLAPGLAAYITKGRETGGFLRSVLENDLSLSLRRADARSLEALPKIVDFLYQQAPGQAWGSPEDVKAWLGGRWKGHEWPS